MVELMKPVVFFTLLVVTALGEATTAQLARTDLAISGTVMYAGTRDPVAGVVVRLNPARGETFFGPPGQDGPTAITNGQGRFRFAGLAAGRYVVASDIPDYTVDGPPTRTIDLTPGPAPDVELWIVTGVTVSGRVSRPDGEAMEDVFVGLMEVAYDDGRRRLVYDVSVYDPFTRTDEDGRYSVTVPPGRYYLIVDPDDRALPVFYPGVDAIEDAIPLTLSPGIDQPGIDVGLREVVGTRRVRFRLSVTGDSPHLSHARLRRLGPAPIESPEYGLPLSQLEDDIWEIQPLPPGVYDLHLRYSGLGTQPGVGQLAARLRLVVDDGDVDLGVVEPDGQRDIAGRFVVQGGEIDPSRLSFRLQYDDDPKISIPATISPDGLLLFEGLPPGLFRLVFPKLIRGSATPTSPFRPAAAAESAWYVASARSGSQDVLRDGLSVSSGPVDPIEIVLADDGGRIEGAARDGQGQFLTDARVVLVPPPNQRGPMLRFPTAAAPDGTWVLNDVPPGTYRLMVLDVAGRPDRYPYWEDPEFLSQYELRGQTITVDAGARMRIDGEAIPIYD